MISDLFEEKWIDDVWAEASKEAISKAVDKPRHKFALNKNGTAMISCLLSLHKNDLFIVKLKQKCCIICTFWKDSSSFAQMKEAIFSNYHHDVTFGKRVVFFS